MQKMVNWFRKRKKKCKKFFLSIFIYSLFAVIVFLCFINYKQEKDKELAEYKLKMVEENNSKYEQLLTSITSKLNAFSNVDEDVINDGIWREETWESILDLQINESLAKTWEVKRTKLHGVHLYEKRVTNMIFPVDGYVTSEFAEKRKDPLTKEVYYHSGLDIAKRTNLKIESVLDAKVIKTGFDKIGGNFILTETIDEDGNIIENYYGHLQQIEVEEGQEVKQGERIALMGNTGRRTIARHLHWSVKINGKLVNPVSSSTFHKTVIDSLNKKTNIGN
jgi:murein DD-endopeptidase MepM/ murein hydrolase activator NlpD